MTTFLEPRNYAEYLGASGRQLICFAFSPADEMRATLLDKTDINSQQVGLFDSPMKNNLKVGCGGACSATNAERDSQMPTHPIQNEW
ncbi:MAG: hypothetical protein ABSA39_18160 [Edaphobacter sp.]